MIMVPVQRVSDKGFREKGMIMDEMQKPSTYTSGRSSLCPNCLTQIAQNVVVGWSEGADIYDLSSRSLDYL